VTTPTLVVWGEADRIADAEHGRAYADAVPGARLRMIANSGHLPQIETPDELAEIVWAFAEQARAGT
jgi:pimeloyl-ACP methyl ester carboxylesterase